MRIELAVPMTNRNNSPLKDGRIVNGLIETTPYGKSVVKRPGVGLKAVIGAGASKGMYTHVASGKIFMAIGTQVLAYVVATGVTTVVGTINPASTFVSFTETSKVPYVVWQDGYTMAAHNPNTGVTTPITGDGVTNISVANPGSGYAVAPLVTVAPPPVGVTATATATINASGQITGITVTNPGTGYITAPLVTIAAPPVSPASVVSPAILNIYMGNVAGKSRVSGVLIAAGGSGYTVAPNFTVTLHGITIALGTTTINASGSVVTATLTTIYSISKSVWYGPLVVNLSTNPPAVAPPSIPATANSTLRFVPPAPYAQGLVYLNDTVFIATRTAIYNSAIEDPLNWGALDFVTKNSEPDQLFGISKHLNYLLAFGGWSCEFWYYAGSPLASPLGRNMSMTLEVGVAHPSSLVQAQSTVFFVGQSRPTGREVYMINQGQTHKISNNHIERYLNADPFTSVAAFTTSQVGHQLYILTLKNSNITLVYDQDEKEWTTFSSVVAGVEQRFSEIFAVDYNNTCYTLDESNGTLSFLSSTLYVDDSGPINFRVVTPRIVGDETKRIYWYGMELIGDKVVGNASLSYSDNDYTTWSVPRNIDLNADRSVVRMLGAARQRAYSLLITGNHAVRLNHINAVITQGNM